VRQERNSSHCGNVLGMAIKKSNGHSWRVHWERNYMNYGTVLAEVLGMMRPQVGIANSLTEEQMMFSCEIRHICSDTQDRY